MKKLKIIISGRVQGVWFRGYTKKIANSLDLKGYVKNLRNGDVEILAKGDNENMDELLNKVRTGPPAARVDSVQTKEVSEPVNYESFKISY
ncbi:MAG: acylphosphatase [Candidatus Cloacimonetes bacterium]|nr:acylphosphatase [Candidatus Cloacimonadota bacterium]MBS3767418.1 acylphosphatase [Candidatus Cloacimonadota bacterium]